MGNITTYLYQDIIISPLQKNKETNPSKEDSEDKLPPIKKYKSQESKQIQKITSEIVEAVPSRHVRQSSQSRELYTNIAAAEVRRVIESVSTAISHSKPFAEDPLDEFELLRALEKIIVKENNFVTYKEKSVKEKSVSPSCFVTGGLKKIEDQDSEQIARLIRQHQNCSGTGCSPDCRALRAALIHLLIFRHRCSVWDTFYKIYTQHSKNCRLISCDVKFCRFMKHELHLNKVPVLSLQLLKERSHLEKEFQKCESVGFHNGDLQCRHLPHFPNLYPPQLPIHPSPVLI